jgi:hypothetical protein
VAAVESVEKLNEPVMAWRDARPEDAGSMLPARFGPTLAVNGFIAEYCSDTPSLNWISNKGRCWSKAQVFAPVEPVKADDGWRPIETVSLFEDVLVQYRSGTVGISSYVAMQDFGDATLWQPLPKARV